MSTERRSWVAYSNSQVLKHAACAEPDFNVNDLALFRALDVLVRKLRRGQGNAYDKEKLVAIALKAAAEYPTEQLGRMWEYKEYVMEAVYKCNGLKNDYPRHRRNAA